jgi:hypothetical protein
MPAGSSAGNQQILQTLIVQQRALQQEVQAMQEVMLTADQRNRAWMENKFRVLNDNIRRFGGTVQSGLGRQDPERQAEVRRYGAEGPRANYQTFNRRGRSYPTLAPNIRDLMVLWNEWEYGIAGRKPAKDWTSQESGGGGNNNIKQMYHRRRNIWRVQQHLVNKGRSIQSANALIEQTYGAKLSITALSEAIAVDRTRF